jgi:hypothetical protein
VKATRHPKERVGNELETRQIDEGLDGLVFPNVWTFAKTAGWETQAKSGFSGTPWN